MTVPSLRNVTVDRNSLPPAIPIYDTIDLNNNYEPVSQIEDPSGKEQKVSAPPD